MTSSQPTTISLSPPGLRGGLLALCSAVLFGVSTPLVQRAGAGMGAWSTAALLYAGAAMIGALLRRPASREAGVRRVDVRTLLGMTLFGAALGPATFAWGLQHTSGAIASLLLTLEAVFTALLSRMAFGEVMDRRIWSAMLLITAGGMVLALQAGGQGHTQWLGLLAVLGATVAWGVDNTLSRRVADRDPGQVVMLKAMLGTAMTAVAAIVFDEARPAIWNALALLGIGAAGYGLSLRLYLLAQRSFGAGRTGSVFAFAPFIGAAAAFAMGDPGTPWNLALGGSLMIAGVLLHLSEDHAHVHVHAALQHEHAHLHDDGHHTHVHDPMPVGSHSHPHDHEPIEHAHPHVPDLHHAHPH